MTEEKLFIKNRKNQNISVLIEIPKSQKGLAFVIHGLGGRKNQPHIWKIREAFIDNNITTISFDTTNSFGESDGDFMDATITNYLQDLEDVINWAKKQNWYKKPFYLAGHSLGSACIIIYAENFPHEIKGLAPISTIVSGKLSLETKRDGDLEKWEKEGIRQWTSNSGIIKRLKWTHIQDRLKYDVLEKIDKIKIPVILIVGENDTSTPVQHHKILFDNLNCNKEMHVIKNADHNFRGKDEEKNLNELNMLLKTWIKKLK